jgi:uncharacterized membrane protein YqiK
VAFLNRQSSRATSPGAHRLPAAKVVLSGGCLVLPFLHKVEEINMRTNRVEVHRTGSKS